MQENGKHGLILRKSYEIAYALFRLSAKMEKRSFAENMTRQGSALLGSAAVGKLEDTANSVTAIEYFVKLGVDLNFITLQNGDVMFRELAGLRSVLEESGKSEIGKDKEIEIADIFSKRQEKQEMKPAMMTVDETGFVEEPKPKEREVRNVMMDSAPVNAETRQERILEKIRQTGNCRIRDLQEVLPECSERTIRYDLQALVEEGIIERRGNGGPAVYYRMRPVEMA